MPGKSKMPVTSRHLDSYMDRNLHLWVTHSCCLYEFGRVVGVISVDIKQMPYNCIHIIYQRHTSEPTI